MELYWSVCADMEFCPPLTPYQLTMIQNKQLHNGGVPCMDYLGLGI